MAANTYDIGDIVRLSGTFTDTGGEPIDPTAVTVQYLDPDGNVTTQGSLNHPSTGFYYVDITVDSPGVWAYRIYSTGTGQSAEESWFRVRHLRVSTST